MFLRRILDIFRKNTKKILSYIFLSAIFFMFSWGINISNISNYNQNNNSKLETLNLDISFDSYKVYAEKGGRFSSPTLVSTLWINSPTPKKEVKNPQTNSPWTSKDAQKWLNIWNWIVAWISAVLWVLTYMVTMLLDPGFTSWTMFWINDKLHQIWILVSNVVYFIFAFLLIWIAFMNIIWKWDKWELKQAMPKFIVWVLIVPFSWFFVNLVVSLANILTFSALALPADTFPSYETVLTKINIPTICTLDLKTWAKEWLHCEKWEKNLWDVTSWSAYWLLSTYTYWLLKIDTLPKVQWHNIASWAIKSIEDLIIYLLFSWIFILVYSILIITLAIVLLVRAVWLWIYLALSPLFWLAYFFWKDWDGDFMKKFNVSEFIWLAMVPVYTVLALSFWFLFLSITMQWLSTDAHKADKSSNYEITEKWMTITLPIKDHWTVKTELKVDDSWAFANLLWDTKSAFNVAKEIWYTNWLWFIWAIFMNIFWVVVFRVAVMAALQASTITKAIVAPIKQFGDSVWSLVSKAPTYAPVFGGQSMQSMSNIASSAQTYYTSTKPSNAASKFMWDHNLFWNKWELTSAVADLKQAISWSTTVNQPILNKANEAMKKAWNANNAWQQKDLVWQLKIIAERTWVANKIIENWWKNKQWYLDLLAAIDRKVENSGWKYWKDFLKNFDAGTETKYSEPAYNSNYNAKNPQDVSASPEGISNQNINIKFANNKIPSDGDLLSLVKKDWSLKSDAVDELLKVLDKKQEMKKDEFLKVLENMLESKWLSSFEAQELALDIIKTKKIDFKNSKK